MYSDIVIITYNILEFIFCYSFRNPIEDVNFGILSRPGPSGRGVG